jgi:hypothetical protein
LNEKNKILNDFKSKKINILLLHPSQYEGISVEGVQHFHILEPLLEYYKQEQLLYRAIRFKSHSHLKKEKQLVNIYMYRCGFTKLFAKFKREKLKIIDWFNNDKFVYYFSRYSKFSEYLSPDDQVYELANRVKNQVNSFNNLMRDLSLDNKNICSSNEDCCIYGDKNCKFSKKCY